MDDVRLTIVYGSGPAVSFAPASFRKDRDGVEITRPAQAEVVYIPWCQIRQLLYAPYVATETD